MYAVSRRGVIYRIGWALDARRRRTTGLRAEGRVGERASDSFGARSSWTSGARFSPAFRPGVDLGDQAVEALEQGVELAVAYVLAFHAPIVRAASTPTSTPAVSIATSRTVACRPATKCWWNSSLAA